MKTSTFDHTLFSPAFTNISIEVMYEAIRFVTSVLTWSAKAACGVHIIHEYFFEMTESKGESMLPTLQARQDYVLSRKLNRLGRNLEIGDIIVAIKPSDPDHRVCKRISGMPGDVILIDPSSSSTVTNSVSTCDQNDGFNKYVTVPEGHVWATGDNLSHSLDSRSYMWLPMGLIKGKAIAAMSLDKDLLDDNGNFWFYNFRRLTNNFIDET